MCIKQTESMKYECSVISCLKMGLSGTVGAFLGFFTTVIVNMCLGIMAVSSRFAMVIIPFIIAIFHSSLHEVPWNLIRSHRNSNDSQDKQRALSEFDN